MSCYSRQSVVLSAKLSQIARLHAKSAPTAVLIAQAVACTQTPIDAIFVQRGSGAAEGGTAGGTARDASTDAALDSPARPDGALEADVARDSDVDVVLPPCDSVVGSVSAARYRIRHRGAQSCLAAGLPTTVGGEPAFEVRLNACKNEAGEHWELSSTDTGVFEVRHLITDYNLDVRFAATADGTPMVLFEPHRLYNQRFRFAPVSGGVFRIVPHHAEEKCLTLQGARVELWPCTATDAQQWELLLCPPSP